MSKQKEKVSHVYMPDSPFETKALDTVSFEIADGEFVGLIGHTGSGKTTLVQHINALMQPTSGRVVVNGINTAKDKQQLRALRQTVGLVFQYPEYQLFEETVQKDVAFGPKNLGLDAEEVEHRVKHSIEQVGLDYDEVKDKSPFELSGGQRRRVAFAGVLSMQPSILILDEPTAGLDPQGRREVLALLKEIKQEREMTIIMISHYMDEIAEACSKVMVMEAGQVAMFDRPEVVFSHSEQLRTMGLDIPVVTKLCAKLQAMGCDVPSDLLTLRQMQDLIIEKLGVEHA